MQTTGVPIAAGPSAVCSALRSRSDDHAVDAAVEDVVEEGALALGQPVGVADVRAVASSVDRVGEPAGEHAEERVGEVGYDDGDHLRTPGAQAACHRVRPVAELADGLHHDGLGGLADESLARQYVRDGGRD